MAIQSCVADAADDATPMAAPAPISGAGGPFGLIVPGFQPSTTWMKFRDLAEVVHLEVGENRRQRNAGLVTDELGVVFGLVLVRRRIAEDCLLEGELDVGGRSQQGR